jgi:hypothetical protein
VIAKELRALLPLWAAAAAAMVLSALIRDLRPFNVPAYFLGAIVLGAMAIGQEYSHRTMGVLLMQPVSRARMLLTKLSVLAALLLGLLLLSFAALPVDRGDAALGQAIRWLPVLAALFIAPYLTLATRSPMAGTVFTMGIAGMLLVGGEWLGTLKYGHAADVESFRLAFLSRMLLLLSVGGAVMTWRTFSRLQVLDLPGTELDFTTFARSGPPAHGVTRRNPILLVIGKELRLQQLAFAVAAIYVVIYLVTVSRTRGMFSQDDVVFLLSGLYSAALAVLIGSVASAEERHLRTLDAQLLLPMRASRQWGIKVAIVLGLTFVLALALPAGLAALFPPERVLWARTLTSMVALSSILAILSIAAVSLYVSTLCSSALWALLLAIPSAFGTALFVLKLGTVAEGSLRRFGVRPDGGLVGWSTALATIAVIALVLRLALANHRHVDRSRWRIAAQLAIAGGSALAATAIVAAIGALTR